MQTLSHVLPIVLLVTVSVCCLIIALIPVAKPPVSTIPERSDVDSTNRGGL